MPLLTRLPAARMLAARSLIGRRLPHTAAAGAALALAVAGLAGCGTSDGSGAGSAPVTTTSSANDAAATTKTVAITITSQGCAAPEAAYPAGALTFEVANKDATAVSEFELLDGDRILGEKENLPPGFSGSFSLQLDPGTYTLYCPGAGTSKSALEVTGKAAATTGPGGPTGSQSLLAQGTREYADYVESQAVLLVAAVKPLAAALKGDDLAAAQDAYKRARAPYERIEPVAESFTLGSQNLDANIDARAGDVPVSQWRGFHYIEKGLFEDKSLDGLAPYGTELLANIEKLQGLVDGLTYQPAEIANGAVGLLDEVAKSKITGEEERYSHIDLLDFDANVEGSEQAFAVLRPGLAEIDPTLASTVQKAFQHLQSKLDTYRNGDDASGFVLYGTLTPQDKITLSQALQAVAEPLSRVAGKVVNG